MTVPVLWQPRMPGRTERRLRGVVQIVLLAVAATIVTTIFASSIRVDRALSASPCGRDGTECTQGKCPTEEVIITGPCEVIEGRRYLADRGLLDDANALYFPTLLLLRDLPATGLLVASFLAAPPPRLDDRRTRLVSLLALTVLVLLVSTHAMFGESIGYATAITD